MKTKIILPAICTIYFLTSCVSTDEITKKSQLANAYRQGDIIVLTTDSSIYKFDRYKFVDSVIVGSGVVEKHDIEKKFDCEINLKDISYIQLRYVSISNTVLAMIATGIVGGVAISYLSSGDNLSVNDYIQHYYPPVGGGGGGGGGGWGWSSCPFIFTYDGNNYFLESETFAGSVFKLAERVSYDNLEFIKPLNGILTLKLANQLLETDYMNELKLLSVDLPDDVIKVLPSIDGKIHTIKKEILPSRCYDYFGEDVKSQIIKKDSIIWTSNLSERNFEIKNNLKDGLIVEFPKPPDVEECKLVVNGKNTELGNFAINQIIKLNGDNLLEWYQSIESDQDKGMQFLEWMLREGLLRISVWNGNEWDEKGAFLDPGPILYHEEIAVIDIKQIDGDVLKIKLETALDLWMIDNIYIDYSIDSDLKVSELQLNKAIDNYSGKDISYLIDADDDEYYITLPGQFAIIEFKVPDKNINDKISYILKTKGYYHPWTSPGEKYDPELIEKIFAEPLLGNKLYMETWRQAKLSQKFE